MKVCIAVCKGSVTTDVVIKEVENTVPEDILEEYISEHPEYFNYEILNKDSKTLRVLILLDNNPPNENNTLGLILFWC